MDFLDLLKNEVQQFQHSVVFSEGYDLRVIQAGIEIKNQNLASEIFLIGNENEIIQNAKQAELDISGLSIIDPALSELTQPLAQRLTEIRSRDFDIDTALEQVKDPLYFAALFHETGRADIHIGGAVKTSAEVIKTIYQIIKPNRHEGIAASYFLMISPDKEMGENGISLFSDGAFNIDPGPKQLARIAYQIGNIAHKIYGLDTRLALLTYSTKGSGSGEPVDLIKEAGEELKKLEPDFLFESEMQIDAAMVPEISERKDPGNSLEGKANVLIFPDLNSGNIGYKLAERYGKAMACGPILVGLNKVASDLSRGCDSKGIVGTFIAASAYLGKK